MTLLLTKRKLLRLAAPALIGLAAPSLLLPKKATAFWQSRDSNYNQSAGAAPSVTTWDPITASGVTFSNANLTVTGAPSGFAQSTTSRAAGKLYFELTYDVAAFLPFSWYASILDSTPSFPNGYVFATNDVWRTNNVATGQFGIHPPVPPVQTGSVAVDFTNTKIYSRPNVGNNWNGDPTANPATNTGGADFSAAIISGFFFILINLGDGPGQVCTLNALGTGGTPFADTVPTGFSAWG